MISEGVVLFLVISEVGQFLSYVAVFFMVIWL